MRNSWGRAFGILTAFTVGVPAGIFIRDLLTPAQFFLEDVIPGLLGFLFSLASPYVLLTAGGLCLWRFRSANIFLYSAVWGFWAGFLALSLLISYLDFLYLTGQATI